MFFLVKNNIITDMIDTNNPATPPHIATVDHIYPPKITYIIPNNFIFNNLFKSIKQKLYN